MELIKKTGDSYTDKVVTGCGTIYLTATDNSKKIIVTMGKNTSCRNTTMMCISILLTIISQSNWVICKILSMIEDGRIMFRSTEAREKAVNRLKEARQLTGREHIINQLSGQRCTENTIKDGEEVLSCIDAISIMLKREHKVRPPEPKQTTIKDYIRLYWNKIKGQ